MALLLSIYIHKQLKLVSCCIQLYGSVRIIIKENLHCHGGKFYWAESAAAKTVIRYRTETLIRACEGGAGGGGGLQADKGHLDKTP